MLVIHETQRLLLQTLNENASPMVLNFYEENKNAFEPWEPLRSSNFYTISYHKASLTAEYQQMAEGKLIRFWVFLKGHPEEIIGSICFQNFLKEPYHSCSLGYKFGSRFQHQGYAQESIKKGIEIIFGDYHLHRIEAHIMPFNEPSLRLIEKLSFQYEGISSSYARVNGVWTDHKQFSLINPSEQA